MCNDYRVHLDIADIASDFGAELKIKINYSAEVFPGRPGLVVAGGELKAMSWGFPRAQISKKTGNPLKPRPVNNARGDDQRYNPFWRESFHERRCLIPVSQWAEAYGEAGSMCKAWYRPMGQELFAVAGIWRPTDEWADAYSMVMVPASPEMIDIHDRMPVILTRDEWRMWTEGSPAEAFPLIKTWQGPLESVRSNERWGTTSPIS